MTIIPFAGHTPQVSETAFVAHSSSLIGRVTVESAAVVLFGAVVRGDLEPIVLGENSNLQDNVVLHTDLGHPVRIGREVSIGHGAIVHGATVEDRCLIGMGAVVLNGAVIGEGSLVAAGAVVLEDTVIPPGSLVAGVPGKVRRALSVDELQHIIDNAQNYVTLARTYRDEGHA